MNDVVPAIAPEAKERRNKAIEFHNASMQAVNSPDKMLAYRLLCSSTTVDPDLAQGWYALGNATADLKMLDASIAAFRRAVELPNSSLSGGMTPTLRVQSLINLSHRLLNAGRIEEALEWNKKVIDALSDPSLDAEGGPFAWTNMSLILSIMGRHDEAVHYAEEAFRRSQEPIIETGLAFALLYAGDYASGLRHFEARFAYKPALNSYLNYPYKPWRGETDPDMTLFVPAEAGLGDSLSFTRFLGMAAARVGKVIYAVQPELVRLFRASLAPIWSNVEVIPITTSFPLADAWCAVGSLPTAMDLTSDEIADQPQGWTPQGDDPPPPDWLAAGRKLHIGIAWAGSPDNDINQWRSIPFTQFLDLYRVPGIQLYGLQVGERSMDLHAAGAAALVRDLSPYIRDATDTVGLMRSLDLTIAAESFLPHLAAACGKEVWVPYSYNGRDWRLGSHGERIIWYPNHYCFKQGAGESWGIVFNRIVEALRERAGDT